MVKTIEGIYENGTIRPSEPIQLKNKSKVLITVFLGDEEKALNLDSLSEKELIELAERRVEKLKQAGINRAHVVRDMELLLDEIREEAVSKNVALGDDDLND